MGISTQVFNKFHRYEPAAYIEGRKWKEDKYEAAQGLINLLG